MRDDQNSLICRVLDRLCALPIRQVVEIMRPLPVEPIGGAPQMIAGVAIIRGAAVPVVDLGFVLAREESQATRFVTINADGRRIALAVDAVLGVQPIPAEALNDLPPLLRNADVDAVATIGALDAELLFALHSARLVPEEVWSSINVTGGAQ